MRKKLKKFAIIGVFTFAVFASLGVAVEASVGWKNVLKSYDLDVNKYTPEQRLFNYVYIDVPSSAYFTYSDTVKIGSGWNYNRFRTTYFYESDLGFH